jgi:NADH/NAD ratio-sensing transcriptional regulator Rex
MNYQELCEKIDSPTLQRDLQYFEQTGEYPGGYNAEERALMEEYLFA